jgi:hypothetical protein
MFRHRESHGMEKDRERERETARANRVNSAEREKLQQTNFASVLYGIVCPKYFNTIYLFTSGILILFFKLIYRVLPCFF